MWIWVTLGHGNFKAQRPFLFKRLQLIPWAMSHVPKFDLSAYSEMVIFNLRTLLDLVGNTMMEYYPMHNLRSSPMQPSKVNTRMWWSLPWTLVKRPCPHRTLLPQLRKLQHRQAAQRLLDDAWHEGSNNAKKWCALLGNQSTLIHNLPWAGMIQSNMEYMWELIELICFSYLWLSPTEYVSPLF